VQTTRYLIRDNQKWTISAVGGGFYRIAVVEQGMGLGVGPVAVENSGTYDSIALEPFTGADQQLWKVDQLTDGSYRIAVKRNHFVLAATINTKPGNGVALQPFTGDDAQRWVVTAP